MYPGVGRESQRYIQGLLGKPNQLHLVFPFKVHVNFAIMPPGICISWKNKRAFSFSKSKKSGCFSEMGHTFILYSLPSSLQGDNSFHFEKQENKHATFFAFHFHLIVAAISYLWL